MFDVVSWFNNHWKVAVRLVKLKITIFYGQIELLWFYIFSLLNPQHWLTVLRMYIKALLNAKKRGLTNIDIIKVIDKHVQYVLVMHHHNH